MQIMYIIEPIGFKANDNARPLAQNIIARLRKSTLA
jgi:hypothetical protein